VVGSPFFEFVQHNMILLPKDIPIHVYQVVIVHHVFWLNSWFKKKRAIVSILIFATKKILLEAYIQIFSNWCFDFEFSGDGFVLVFQFLAHMTCSCFCLVPEWFSI